MMKAEPHWYTPRLLLLGAAMMAAIRNAPGAFNECLPPDGPGPLPAPTSHPERALAEVLDRVPRVAEIVGKRHVLDSDFKCAARESDYPSVVAQIARFAMVRVSVAPLAAPDDDRSHYDVRVSHEGVGAVIRLSSDKYAEVSPIVDYLNRILAARQDPRTLCRFIAGGFEGGVVLATPNEVDRLREAGYLREDR